MTVKTALKSHKNLIAIIGILSIIVLAWSVIKTFSNPTADSSWDGVVSREFTSGTGSEQNPYVISNGGELAHFKELLEGESAAQFVDKIYKIKSRI